VRERWWFGFEMWEPGRRKILGFGLEIGRKDLNLFA